MFGTLGGQEIILILVLALIVFGPRKLPEIGKSIGRMMAEFRKASNDFRRTLEDEVEAEKLRPPDPVTSVSSDPPAAGSGSPDPSVPVSATAEPSDREPPSSSPPDEPTVSRPEPAAVGPTDGRPVD
jgi:Tat protein translocase TatB subunit